MLALKSSFRFGVILVLSVLASTQLWLARGADTEEDAAGSSLSVPMLTESNFTAHINSQDYTLVKFMAPWCTHCKRLAPIYANAATKLSEKKVSLVEVDATQEKALAEKFDVKGFPTLMFFQKGIDVPHPYHGGRTEESIIDWVTKMISNPVTWVESEESVREAAKTKTVFLAKLKEKTGEGAKVYESVADAQRMKGEFFAIVDPKMEGDVVTAMRPDEEPVSTGLETENKLKAWVEGESVPYFGPVSGDNYATYAARTENWFWLCGSEEDYKEKGSIIRPVSKNYRTNFNFVWLDLKPLKQHCESALSLMEYPSVAITYDNGVYHHKEGDMTEKDLTKWIESVLSGKAEKFFKSEPVPETNDEPVKVVVGKSFHTEVFSKDHDTFLEIYAPWCGHCKKLAPVWEAIAQATAKSADIKIAKIDGTANEIDHPGFKFGGFPTLYYVKADTDKPISYTGDRSQKDLVDFIKTQNPKISFVGLKEDDAEKDDGDKEEL